jgi:hypothetical protein
VSQQDVFTAHREEKETCLMDAPEPFSYLAQYDIPVLYADFAARPSITFTMRRKISRFSNINGDNKTRTHGSEQGFFHSESNWFGRGYSQAFKIYKGIELPFRLCGVKSRPETKEKRIAVRFKNKFSECAAARTVYVSTEQGYTCPWLCFKTFPGRIDEVSVITELAYRKTISECLSHRKETCPAIENASYDF